MVVLEGREASEKPFFLRTRNLVGMLVFRIN